MNKVVLILAILAWINIAQGQFIKRMADRAKSKIEQKAGEKIDKGIDDTVDGKKKDKKKAEGGDGAGPAEGDKTSSGGEKTGSGGGSKPEESVSEDAPSLKTYSKYDFIPGDKVIAVEDFSGTEVGDFPLRWNTNASAEVVTVNSRDGKWLKFTKKGNFHPEFITSIPANFTLEFDLGVNDKWNSYHFAVNFANLRSPDDFVHYGYYAGWRGDHVVHLGFKPSTNDARVDANSVLYAGKDGDGINNNVNFNTWDNQKVKFAHVSIWRQNQRLRVYVNGEKIWDVPRAFDAASTYNAVTMGVADNFQESDMFVMSNIRFASGAPDTRTRLITEGKFVTRGILFDVNSDAIKAESYGTIKDIANVLKENAGVRVKVIGHTDSDGDEKMNLDLSKRRAASVKTALVSEFGIEDSRIEVDGKGESQPVDKAETALGKANNRRVEFIKL